MSAIALKIKGAERKPKGRVKSASFLIVEVKTRPAKTETAAKLLHLVSIRNGVWRCFILHFRVITLKHNNHHVSSSKEVISQDITKSILNERPLLEWSHSENNYYKPLAGRIPDFASIKPLRSYINALVKSAPMAEFSK